MRLQIDLRVLGPLETNCYVLRFGQDCWVVDPGMDPAPLLAFLRGQSACPSRILLTHGHGDHIGGVGELLEAYPRAILCCPAGDAFMLPDAMANLSAPFGMDVTCPQAQELLRPGQVLAMGERSWQLLDTAGHTPGGMSFYCPRDKVVLTGDALFAGSIGRADIPGASLGRLVKNIRLNLLSLPEDTQVLPGHGEPTTIGREKRLNPFLILAGPLDGE